MLMTLHPVLNRRPSQHLLLLCQVVGIVILAKILESTASTTERHAEVLLRGVYPSDVDIYWIGDFFRLF